MQGILVAITASPGRLLQPSDYRAGFAAWDARDSCGRECRSAAAPATAASAADATGSAGAACWRTLLARAGSDRRLTRLTMAVVPLGVARGSEGRTIRGLSARPTARKPVTFG